MAKIECPKCESQLHLSCEYDGDRINGLQIFDLDVDSALLKPIKAIMEHIPELLHDYLKKSCDCFRPLLCRIRVLGNDRASAKPWLVIICLSPAVEHVEAFFQNHFVRKHLAEIDIPGGLEVAFVGLSRFDGSPFETASEDTPKSPPIQDTAQLPSLGDPSEKLDIARTVSTGTNEGSSSQDSVFDGNMTRVSSFTIHTSFNYVCEIATNLLERMPLDISDRDISDRDALERVYTSLHGQLKALALKLGHDTEDQRYRDMMVFIYGNESQIIECLKGAVATAESRRSRIDKAKRVQEWLSDTTPLEAPEENDNIDEEATQTGLEDTFDKEDILSTYGRLVFEEPAYEWLVGCIEREYRTTRATPDVAGSIRGKILESFQSSRSVSRRQSAESYKAVFQVQWDPRAFMEDEAFEGSPEHAIETAITLTGSTIDAQALTCCQYLYQTWPATGKDIMGLIKAVVSEVQGQRHSCNLAGKTKITVWTEGKVITAMVLGTAHSIAEVGEQFAWIGSALRSSPDRSGLVSCTPNLSKRSSTITSENPSVLAFADHVVFDIEFTLKRENERHDIASCRCWHALFHNPVIVQGYPILRRCRENTGLELPLSMMAGLIGAKRASMFDGKVFIKGPGSMLVPTGQDAGTVYWHIFQQEDHRAVGYRDYHGFHAPISFQELENPAGRHIVGWLREANILAGTSKAAKPIRPTGLPGPTDSGALKGTSIQRQIDISQGFATTYGLKDRRRQGWTWNLLQFSKRYIIFWDVETKRGWMTNGTTAFLHLMRTSLELYRKNARAICEFKQSDIRDEGPSHRYDSALQVLLRPENDGLLISNTDSTSIGDLILDFIHIFDSVFQLEEGSRGKRQNATQNAGKNHETLEGWDFTLLAERSLPIAPCRATIRTLGRSWTELSRTFDAVAIFGRDLGELIQPIRVDDYCQYWKHLSCKENYLAALVPDVQGMMYSLQTQGQNPRRLFNDILRHQNMENFQCSCGSEHDSKNHVDIVSLLKPFDLELDPDEIYWHDANNPGAVILGDSGTRFTSTPVANEVRSALQHASSDLSQEVSDEVYESDCTETVNMVPSIPQSSQRKQRSMPKNTDKVGKLLEQINCRTRYRRPKQYTQFQVAIICALAVEANAVLALLDETWSGYEQPEGDFNAYSAGRIGSHAVVVVHLAGMGKAVASSAAKDLRRTCKGIKLVFIVGICGGVRSPEKNPEILLGDVVISKHLIQHDLQKQHDAGPVMKQGYEHDIPPPDMTVQAFLRKLETPLVKDEVAMSALRYMNDLSERGGPIFDKYKYPGFEHDKLYRRSYQHKHRGDANCESCFSEGLEGTVFCEPASRTSCLELGCDSGKLIGRTRLKEAETRRAQRTTMNNSADHPTLSNPTSEPWIHFGVVASGDTVMKSAKARDEIALLHDDLLAIEMEGAEVWRTVPSIVVKGVCDYSDSHKNDLWHNYAAGTAAACAKALLDQWAVRTG